MRIAPIVSPAMQELHIGGIPELCISIILVQRELRISGIRELRISGIYQDCAFKLTWSTLFTATYEEWCKERIQVQKC